MDVNERQLPARVGSGRMRGGDRRPARSGTTAKVGDSWHGADCGGDEQRPLAGHGVARGGLETAVTS